MYSYIIVQVGTYIVPATGMFSYDCRTGYLAVRELSTLKFCARAGLRALEHRTRHAHASPRIPTCAGPVITSLHRTPSARTRATLRTASPCSHACTAAVLLSICPSEKAEDGTLDPHRCHRCGAANMETKDDAQEPSAPATPFSWKTFRMAHLDGDDALTFSYSVAKHESTTTRRILEFAANDAPWFNPPVRLCERQADSTDAPDFVWRNKATVKGQELRRTARVYNHLCGAHILEDKALLALLLQKSNLRENSLKSFVFPRLVKFMGWCRSTHESWGSSIWVAKSPKGNSGTGIWMLHAGNWEHVCQQIAESIGNQGTCDEGVKTTSFAVVVQQYVENPLLWRGRKLQFRVYAIVTGGLGCWVYRHGLRQVCNKPYTKFSVPSPADGAAKVGQVGSGPLLDEEVHITNVCKNMRNQDLFTVEMPTDIAALYPRVFASACASFADLIRVAHPFLRYQRSPHHFEYIGLDFVADADTGTAYLIECNCPPNNSGSPGVPEAFHQMIVSDILRNFVLAPLARGRHCTGNTKDPVDAGLWECIVSDTTSEAVVQFTREPSMLAQNALSWLIYEKRTCDAANPVADYQHWRSLTAGTLGSELDQKQEVEPINLASGSPSPDLIGTDVIEISTCAMFAELRAAGTQHCSKKRHPLVYGTPGGDRTEFLLPLAHFLHSSRGIESSPDNLVATAGCSHGLDMCAGAFDLGSGDVVLVEDPTYFKALGILRDRGLEIHSVNTDAAGMRIDEAERIVKDLSRQGQRVAILYIVPSFSNPCGIVYTLERRRQLIELCARHDIFLVADEPYDYLYHEVSAPPPPPMAVIATQMQSPARVASLGSFSKILAPALRCGWIEASAPIISRMRYDAVQQSGGCIAQFAARSLVHALESGLLLNHVHRTRRSLSLRAAELVAALRNALPSEVSVGPVVGGFFVWVCLPPQFKASDLLTKCQESSTPVTFRTGDMFSPSGNFRNCLRLCFAKVDIPLLREGARVIGECFEKLE